MTCIDFSMSGWSNTISVLANVFTIIGVCLALYIYCQWAKQKRREAVASDAGALAKEITIFREAVNRFRNVKPRRQTFIYYMEGKRDSIEYDLKEMALVNKDLVYRPYIRSMQELINELRDNSCSDDSMYLLKFGKETNLIVEKLRSLKLYRS